MISLQQSFQNEINEWLSHEWAPCVKDHEVKENPYCKDEFMISFVIKLNFNLSRNVYPLTIKHRFFTFAQNKSDANPEGDLYQLKIFLQRLDSEFQAQLDSMTS